MLSNEYNDIDQFVYSCRKNRKELDAKCVLSKIYGVNELRKFAELLTTNVSRASGAGLAKRYSVAEIIGAKVSAGAIGDQLSNFDHSQYFPVRTYYRPPRRCSEYLSYENFIAALSSHGINLESGFWQKFNGITQPPPHNCLLESVKLFNDEQIVSMLFSCTRVLVCPHETMTESNLFLARIPILIQVHFTQKNIEFSMPSFCEPVAEKFGFEMQAPVRYQEAFSSAHNKLLELVPYALKSIRFDDLPLWLESKYEASDMGWKIAPQIEADFDLTQNIIPLKEILDNFISTLNRECETRGVTHKLQGIDLYHVFRSLKDESYTYSMVQKVPLGKRGGGLLLSILYGGHNAQHYPIVLLANPHQITVDNLREAVSKLYMARIENPYSIDSLFVD